MIFPGQQRSRRGHPSCIRPLTFLGVNQARNGGPEREEDLKQASKANLQSKGCQTEGAPLKQLKQTEGAPLKQRKQTEGAPLRQLKQSEGAPLKHFVSAPALAVNPVLGCFLKPG